MDELQQTRRGLQQDIQNCESEYAAARALAKITDGQIERLLRHTGRQIREGRGERLKDFIQQPIEKVEFDPISGGCRIEYATGIDRHNMTGDADEKLDLAGLAPMDTGHRNNDGVPRGSRTPAVDTKHFPVFSQLRRPY
ncbi:MAG: hypothetical protein GKR94_34085 [Gammaproteobacteria bacterium]|nr:hypothetical protein [Gammaproteobacteria bacterium]